MLEAAAGEEPAKVQTRTLSRALALVCGVVALISSAPQGYAQGGPKETASRDRRWLQARSPRIEVLFGYDAPPEAYHDETGEYVGLLVDVLKELEAQLDYRFHRRLLNTWEDLVHHARRARRFIIVGIAATRERRTYLRFTNAFIKVPYVVITRRSRPWGGMAGLRQKRVCAVRSYAIVEWLRRHYPELETLGVRSDLEGLRRTSVGSCDAMITSQMLASFLIESEGISNLRFAAESGYVNRLAVAVSIHDHELFDVLDRAVDRIPQGRKRELYRRWVSPARSGLSRRAWGWIGAIVGTLVLALLLLWLWNGVLRRRVRRRSRDLTRSERRFRTLFDNISDPVFLQEFDEGRVVDANAAAITCYGLEETHDAKGGRLVHGPSPEPWDELQRRLDTTGDRGELLFETTHRTSAGERPVWVRSRIMGSAEAPLLLSVCRDLSERKTMDRERQEHEAHLHRSQRLHSMGEFAGGVAHDMNNLLTPIMGFAELLSEDLRHDTEAADSVEQILSASQKAQVLLRRLLTLGRKSPLELRALNLNQVVADFERFLRRMLRDDIELHLALDPDLPSLRGDPHQLEQVVMNLAQNAQHAMETAGELRISTAVTDEGELRLEVADSGNGMSPEVRERLFEPFFSTKGEQGSGLGLAVVHGIIEQHRGSIEVESTPGSGTTFTITLPPSPEQTESEDAAVQDDRPQGAGRGETILVVEDDEQVRDLAVTVLRRAGYQLLVASNGHEALELEGAHDGTVELLLTDVIMPGVDGKELHRRLSARRRGLQVLYMSGYSADIIATRGVLAEGVALLHKPFAVEALLSQVQRALSTSESPQPK